MLVAVGADPAFLPVGGRAGSPKFLSPSGSKSKHYTASGSTLMKSSYSMLGWGQRRFSSTSPERAPPSPERAPPVSCLSSLEKTELLKLQWVEALEFLREFRPLEDSRSNSLNLEIPGFADRPDFHFSGSGRPIFHRLTYLALVNNNRGYCVKDSFTIDNILICPELLEVRFKEVKWTFLDVESEDCNRFATYKAAGTLMLNLLAIIYGSDALFHLSEEATDFFGKLRWPSDERLVIYHTSFLSPFGRSWMFQWLYQVCYKVIPHSEKYNHINKDMKKLKRALQAMAYTDTRITIEDIIKLHGLLYHIDNSAHVKFAEMSDSSTGGSREQKSNDVLRSRGLKAVAVPRHTILHCFDKNSKKVRSIRSTDDSPVTMWPYSLDDVVNMLKTVMPLFLLKAQEAFLHNHLWSYLQMENFWPRELCEMGDVPKPTPAEAKLIGKIPYGKRRIQGRKFGHFEERPNGP